jgi:hypothetical protein
MHVADRSGADDLAVFRMPIEALDLDPAGFAAFVAGDDPNQPLLHDRAFNGTTGLGGQAPRPLTLGLCLCQRLLRRGLFTLALDRVDAGDLSAELAEVAGSVQLFGRRLKTQPEQLLLRFRQREVELLTAHFAKL